MSQYPNVKFMLGAAQPRQFPTDEGAEVAMVGRSNSGKSSAINTLLGRRGLARISKTPGLTQQINFFELEPGIRLVDLPGYGFAKVPQAIVARWRHLLECYFTERASLGGIVLVMDARRPLAELDWQMLRWTGSFGIAAHLLLTKADKLKRNEAGGTLRRVQGEVGDLATAQLFSSLNRDGLDEGRARLKSLLAHKRTPAALPEATGAD